VNWRVDRPSRAHEGRRSARRLSVAAHGVDRGVDARTAAAVRVPSPVLDGAPFSNMAKLTLLRRMDADKATTVHGFCCATFSTWAYETAAARPDIIEACLAHRESDCVKAAYNRAQFAAERRALLLAWADYLGSKVPANELIEFPRAKAA
jgi:hypothetical protein